MYDIVKYNISQEWLGTETLKTIKPKLLHNPHSPRAFHEATKEFKSYLKNIKDCDIL